MLSALGALDANMEAPGSCDVGGAISFYPQSSWLSR